MMDRSTREIAINANATVIPVIGTNHTSRTTAFTLEKLAIKTGYIFEIYRFR